MLFNSAIISTLLFASAVLARRHSKHRKSHLLQHAQEHAEHATHGVQDSTNWAGAVLNAGDGTFFTVRGTFTVPHVSGQSGSGSAAWVGIDGNTCTNALFQTGVDLNVGENGPEYYAWYEWYPDIAYYYDDFSVNAGDVIEVSVAAFSRTTGIASIHNMNTGQERIQHVSSTHALCGQNAEWIVEDYEEGYPGSEVQVPFANFGAVFFTNTEASGPSGTYDSSSATILEIQQNGAVIVYTTIDGPDISISLA
ncbi:hypothetical protein OG21DRAFT_1505243 [Imleria badia]|nr:hypothetical protein OG21DRAFT_1505243 [Imleria badia]